MDFSLTDEQQAFRRDVRKWFEENLPEGWIEGETSVPDDEEDRVEFLIDWQKTLYEGGWAGLHWPEEYDGRGASLIEQTIFREEMGRVGAPMQINRIGINLVGPTLMELGTEEQRERFVPNILSAEEIWCQGYSEPGAGSDVASLTTKADRDGEQFVINGQKTWTSFAHCADYCFLVARTDFSGTKHEGLTTFLIDMDQPNVTIEPIHQADDDSHFNEVFFDDAVVHEDRVVGEVDQGWDVVMTLSSFEHATTRIYEVDRWFKDLLEYLETTERGGQPVIQDPHIRQQVADIGTRLKAAKLTHLRNVSKQMETGVPGPEGSMNNVVSDELRNDIGNLMKNVMGPATALWEDDPSGGKWDKEYLMSYGLWIAAGTGDIQRNIIGERVLDLPKDIKSKESHRS